jgi:hypothetical protein
LGAIARLLKHAELAAGKGLKDVLTTIEMPEVKVATGRSANATRTKPAQRGTMPGTII